MATLKQKELAKAIIDNVRKGNPETASHLMARVGYSRVTIDKLVNRTIQSEGVRSALNDFGFNEDNAKKIVGKFVKTPIDETKITPEIQLRAAQEIFKVHGSYAPEKSQSVSVNVDVPLTQTDTKINSMRKEYKEKLRQQLLEINEDEK